jgi:hypothetical protein
MIKQGMIKFAVLVALVCLIGVGVRAQDVNSSSSTDTNATVQPLSFGSPISGGSSAVAKPRPALFGGESGFQWYIGYAYLDTNITEGNDGEDNCNDVCAGRAGAHGFDTSVAYWINPNFGLMADFSATFGGPKLYYPDEPGGYTKLDTNSYYFLFGPTVAKKVGKVNLSAHALVGLARLWADACFTDDDGGTCFRELDENENISTGFAVGLGGSADWMFSNKMGWRVIQVDWLWSDNRQIYDSFDFQEQNSVSAVRISTGLVFNFGGMK